MDCNEGGSSLFSYICLSSKVCSETLCNEKTIKRARNGETISDETEKNVR